MYRRIELTTFSLAAPFIGALFLACGGRTPTLSSDYAMPTKPAHDAGGVELSHAPPPCSGDNCGVPTSCWLAGAGTNDCGSNNTESCCTSPTIDGGTFLRSNDVAVLKSAKYPATVSPYRLDRFEVTVGRFRHFVESWTGSNSRSVVPWRPASGLGKHTQLNGGNGLVVATNDGGAVYESGWDAAWNAALPLAPSAWTANLTSKCATLAGPATWTASPGNNEALAINCVTWQEAYAFCIWDDAFLPSEAEWNFAAAGGADQREFPWSPPPDAGIGPCSDGNFATASDGGACGAAAPRVLIPGTFSPAGDSKWGQADLGGNVQEWVLDSVGTLDAHGPVDMYSGYVTPCTDCVTAAGARKVARGGSFAESARAAVTSQRAFNPPGQRSSTTGFRCARPTK